MNATTKSTNGPGVEQESQFINVVAYDPKGNIGKGEPIKITSLWFWDRHQYCHPVTEETVNRFMLHVNINGAFIDPTSPDKGCSASSGGDPIDQKQAVAAWQISFNGEVIYCKNKVVHH